MKPVMPDIYLMHEANMALGMGKIIPAFFYICGTRLKLQVNIMKPDMPDIHLMHEANTTLLNMGKIIPAFDLRGCNGSISMWDPAMSADLIIDKFH